MKRSSQAENEALAGPVGEASGAPVLSLEERQFYGRKLLRLVDQMERIYRNQTSELARRNDEIEALAGDNGELAMLLDRLVAVVERSLNTDGWDAARRAIETLAALLSDVAASGGDPGRAGESGDGATARISPSATEIGFQRAGERPFRDVSKPLLDGEFADEAEADQREWPDPLRDAVAAYLRDVLRTDTGAPLEPEDAFPIVPSFAAGMNQKLTIALDPDSAHRPPDIAIGADGQAFELLDPDAPAAAPPVRSTPHHGDPRTGVTSTDPDDPFLHFYQADDETADSGNPPGAGRDRPAELDIPEPETVGESEIPILEFQDMPDDGGTATTAEEGEHLFDKFPDPSENDGAKATETPELDIPEPAPDDTASPPMAEPEPRRRPDIKGLMSRLQEAAERAQLRMADSPESSPSGRKRTSGNPHRAA